MFVLQFHAGKGDSVEVQRKLSEISFEKVSCPPPEGKLCDSHRFLQVLDLAFHPRELQKILVKRKRENYFKSALLSLVDLQIQSPDHSLF